MFWVGHLNDEGIVRSEAFYGLHRVSTILDTLGQVDRDPEKAAEILNYDADSDGFGTITPAKISEIAEFASNHRVVVVRQI